MKKVLITGINSYVGNSFEEWLKNYPDDYLVDKISLRDSSWKHYDFSSYDVVLHVSGIAHRRETAENRKQYFKVNRDLAYEVAQKTKREQVPHLIFLSSMSVYGMDTGIIKSDTTPHPKSNYGKSKLEAEKLIKSLEDDTFKVAILRPPMIYGKGCKGNYTKLSTFAIKLPVFPKIYNKRSMIYIDNLSELIRNIIESLGNALYFPQNKEYVCTSTLVKIISEMHGNNIHLTKIFNPIIYLIKIKTFKKVFGDLIYEKSMSHYEKINYTVVNFRKSIEITEDKV